MITGLQLTQFSAGTVVNSSNFFLLNTCQRVLCLGYQNYPWELLENHSSADVYFGEFAYQHLLTILCGLESKILAENEIVHQFKEAYIKYLSSHNRNSQIIKVLEKLLKDSKEIRSKYLYNIGQHSYAGITRILLEKYPSRKALIIGNGSMCQSLVKVLKKKFSLFVTGRNLEKVSSLNLPIVPWLDFNSWSNFPLIVNTIGSQMTIFEDDFFDSWFLNNPDYLSRRFIDLGCPSVLKTRYTAIHGITLLKDIFEKGDILGQEKQEKIKMARVAIREIVNKRATPLNLGHGAKELQLA